MSTGTDAKKTELAPAPEKDKAEEKARNAEIVKRATAAFLQFRKALTALVSPELGVIDDLTVTWISRYVVEKAEEAAQKMGRMHVSLHTKTPPDGENRRQIFNSFVIDSNVSFEKDLHPAVEEEEEKKKLADEEAHKQTGTATEEHVQEIVSAAAAKSDA